MELFEDRTKRFLIAVLNARYALVGTVGSRFATVRFRTIHFYAPCQVGPTTPDLCCMSVATQACFLYLVRF